MASTAPLWRHDAITVTPLSANAPTPAGVLEIVIPPVDYPPLSGSTPSSFSRTDWIVLGVSAVALTGLALLLARYT